MITYAERPATAVVRVSLPAASGAAARDLALAFLYYASACWRGEESARRFATRLGAYWRSQLPPMPTLDDVFLTLTGQHLHVEGEAA